MRKRGALLLLVSLALLGGCWDGDQEAKDRAAAKAKAAADREDEIGRKLAASVRRARARGAKARQAKARRAKRRRARAARLKREREQQTATQQQAPSQEQEQTTPQQQAPEQARGGDTFPCMSDPSYTCSRSGPPRKTGPAEPKPDTTGPNDPCPPGKNYVAPDGCVGGDY